MEKIEGRDVRNSTLTISSVFGSSDVGHPNIRLQGKWLEKLGWMIGAEVHVCARTEAIVITHCPLSADDTAGRVEIQKDNQWTDCVLKMARRAMEDDYRGSREAVSKLSKELAALVDEKPSSKASDDVWEDIKKTLKLALESARYSECGRDVKGQVVSENPAVSCPCLDVLKDFLSRICK